MSALALANVEALAAVEEFTITCSQNGSISPAVCWDTEWSYLNCDAWCYWTGYMKDICYAGKVK